MRVLGLIGLVAVSSLFSVGVAAAGDVIVTAKSGKLSLKGSIDADVVTITEPTVDEVQVTPGAATTVNGAAVPALFAVTAGVTADLGAGDDALTFQSIDVAGGMKIKLGDGFDRFTFTGSQVREGLTLDLGSGAASVSVCDVAVAKNLTIKGGVAGPGLAEAGCVGVTNSDVSAQDGFAIALGDFAGAGNLGVKLKTGSATVILANSGAQGKGTFTFGDGTTLLGLCDAGIGKNLGVTMKKGAVNGFLECEIGELTTNVNIPHGVIVAGADIDGSFTLKTGPDSDGLALIDSSIGGKLKASLSNGLNLVSILGALVGTSLDVKGGKDADLFTAGTLTVGDDLKLGYGDGGNLITLGDSTVGGDLTIKTGADDDFITTNQATIGGKTTIKPGGGTNTVTQ